MERQFILQNLCLSSCRISCQCHRVDTTLVCVGEQLDWYIKNTLKSKIKNGASYSREPTVFVQVSYSGLLNCPACSSETVNQVLYTNESTWTLGFVHTDLVSFI